MKKVLYIHYKEMYLLVWSTEIAETQVKAKRRLSFIERHNVFLILALATLYFLFFLLVTNGVGEYFQSVCEGEGCDVFSDENVFKKCFDVG